METHQDSDFWNRLRERATESRSQGAANITAGAPNEPTLDEYNYHGMQTVRRPDDEQGIVRISVGGGFEEPVKRVRYCVFRGSPEVCAALLDEAARAIRQDG